MKTLYSFLTIVCFIDLLGSISDHNVNAAIAWFSATCFAFLLRVTIPYLKKSNNI